MTLVETKKFLALMGMFYQNWKPNADLGMIAEAWHYDLQHYPLDDINAAFAIYRSQGNQFPPSQPGVLISLLVDATDDSLSESDAWALANNARHNGIYGSQQEFDALPEDVQKAVGSPKQLYDWALATPEAASVIESNFKKAYRAVLERKKQEAMIPENVRRLMDERKAKLYGLQGQDGGLPLGVRDVQAGAQGALGADRTLKGGEV